MAKKNVKLQTDLFGNPVKERDFKKRVYEIEEKINPLEEPTEFDHDFWEKKAQKFKELGDQEHELQVYNKFIERSGFTSPYELRKGTLLVDMGEYDEAMKTLKNLYGCESHDTIVAPAQVQIARISAIQGKKEDMINYLKEAFRTTIFFEGIGTYYGKRELIRDIAQVTEFEKYRDTEEFQEVLNFDWEREDEIQVENKINHYLKEKNINHIDVDVIHLRLLEYLCEYTEKEVYLDFNIELNWLVNTSNSIVIVHDKMLEYQNRFKGRIHYPTVSFAQFDFYQDRITKIKPLDSSDKIHTINDVVYDKADVELALKIIDDPINVDILDTLVFRGIESSLPHSLGKETYKFRAKRRSYAYAVVVFPTTSKSKESINNFFTLYGNKNLFKVGKIFKIKDTEKFKKPPDTFQPQLQTSPLKTSMKVFLNHLKSEINEIKDIHTQLETLLENTRTYFNYFLKEDAVLISNYIIETITIMLRDATGDKIKDLIINSGDMLYFLLKSIEVGFHNTTYQSMNYLYSQVKDKIMKIKNEDARLFILVYFDRHGAGDPKMLHPELKAQFIKAKIPIIKSLLEYNYVRRLNIAERTEIIEKIKLDDLRRHLSTELSSWHRDIYSRGNTWLFELLYTFSKYKVQKAKIILNNELEDNVDKFNGNILKQLIQKKYFSFMEPEKIHRFSTKLDFEQIFTELKFIQGVHLVERLSKMGYKNAQETIKNQALKLALSKKVNTATKTFKKYVRDEELAEFLKSHDS
ncbi:MAG: tetratricopeptide repeat protein [Promethearchaeota archaeon]